MNCIVLPNVLFFNPNKLFSSFCALAVFRLLFRILIAAVLKMGSVLCGTIAGHIYFSVCSRKNIVLLTKIILQNL